MKKIILILLMLIATSSQAQWFGTEWFMNYSSASGYVYNARATLFFARVSADGITLTATQKTFYNNLFQNLIDSGLVHATDPQYDSLEVFYWFAVSDTAVAVDSNLVNLNLLQDNYNAIHYGTVVYTDSGVVGNGSDGYLTTQFTPYLDSSIYKLNSSSIGAYNLKEYVKDKGQIFIGTGWYNYNFDTVSFSELNNVDWSGECNLSYYPNSTNNTPTKTILSSIGLWIGVRQGLSAYIWENGESSEAIAVDPIGATNNMPRSYFGICTEIYYEQLDNGVWVYGNPTSSLVNSCISSAFIGSGLSATKSRALSNCINENLKLFGYNVY